MSSSTVPVSASGPTSNGTSAGAPKGTLPLDTKNIQGDILIGFPKKAETFFFFQIAQVAQFKAALSGVLPLITTADQVSTAQAKINEHKATSRSLLPISFANIAFSNKGLQKLGVTDSIKDQVFTNGMLSDAQSLGDGQTEANGRFVSGWQAELATELHGVLLVAAHNDVTVQAKLTDIIKKLGTSVTAVYSISGKVRPGKEDGHEHFGFEDGISQPAIDGFDKEPLPGQDSINPGIIILGRGSDAATQRPAWAVDGSLLAFRQLNQLVPEFNQFLNANAIKTNDPTVSGSELLGARLNGRWKSGAPIDIVPLRDDPEVGKDELSNNDFMFDPSSQDRCPFGAHIRKMNPRADLTPNGLESRKINIDPHRILRRGIQFGPEVTPSEDALNVTQNARGLLFVCYQSNLGSGFQFLQKLWANNQSFPPHAVQPGFDPLIGQQGGAVRTMSGANPLNGSTPFNLGSQRFVVPKGGEYFFSPSISALRDTFAKKT